MLPPNYYELTLEEHANGRDRPAVDSPAGVATNISLITSSGGLAGFEQAVMIPYFAINGTEFCIGTFDVKNYDTEDSCEIWYRQEEIIEGREITVTRVRIVYRDLGICTLTCTVETAQGSKSITLKIGSADFSGVVKTDYFDLVVTGERPQLKLKKEANSGPLNLISLTMITGVEMAEQM